MLPLGFLAPSAIARFRFYIHNVIGNPDLELAAFPMAILASCEIL